MVRQFSDSINGPVGPFVSVLNKLLMIYALLIICSIFELMHMHYTHMLQDLLEVLRGECVCTVYRLY